MKAIRVKDDDNRTLVWDDTDTPAPQQGQVRIRVAATAINRADLLQRRGLYPVPPGASQILGLEASGTIEALGSGVEGWSEGDEVCVLLEGGGYAEYVVVDASMLLPIPRGVSLVDAAALPEVFYTAWLNLFMEAGVQKGEHALIHAAASGVGTAALQLCRAFGVHAYATASTAKLDACREHGAEVVIDRKHESFKERIRATRGRDGVDVILDMVGASYLADNVDVLATDGRMVVIGLLGGAKAEIALNKLLMKRARIIGSTLRSRSREDKVEITDQLREHVWPRIESGEIKAVIDSTLPISEVNAAHQLLERNQTVGKVLLQIAED